MKDTVMGWLCAYISGLPFYRNIGGLLSQLFSKLMPLDECFNTLGQSMPEQEMLAGFTGVLLASFFMMLFRMLFNVICALFFKQNYIYEHGKLMFKSKFLNLLLGMTDSVWGTILRAFADMILLYFVNLFVNPIVSAVSDNISDQWTDLEDIWVELLTFLIILIVISLLYNLVYYIGNIISGYTSKRKIFKTVLSKCPVFRSLVVHMIPEGISVILKDAAVIYGFMMLSSKFSIDRILVSIIFIFCAIVISNYAGDLLRYGVVSYFRRTNYLNTIAGIFALLEEMLILTFMMVTSLAIESEYNITAMWINNLPFSSYLEHGEGSLNTLLADTSTFNSEIIHALLFVAVLIGLNRLIYAMPIHKTTNGIFLTAGFWWFKVTILVISSAGIYYEIILPSIEGASITALCIVSFVVIALMMYFYPPMAQLVITGTAVMLLIVYLSTRTNLIWFTVESTGDVKHLIITFLGFLLLGFISALLYAVLAVQAYTLKLAQYKQTSALK